MKSVLTLVVMLMLLIGSAYSCYPCKCGNFNWGGIWINSTKQGDCRNTAQLKLSYFPLTVDPDIDGINLYGQSITVLKENQFTRFTKLEIFLALKNQINYIHKDAFKNMTKLKILGLGLNNITALPNELFTNTPLISQIWAQKNKLTILHNNLFSNLLYLKEIHLFNNEINFIEENCFANLPSLIILELQNNFLKTLQLNIDNDLSSLKLLRLFNNNWNCDESLCEVINAIVTHELGDSRIPKCATPKNVKGKLWNQLKLQDFTPSIVSNVTSIQEGDDLVLQCKYCFPSNITWIWNISEIPKDSHQIAGKSVISTLTRKNVQKDETGKYKCHVKDCTNCQDAWVYVDVNEKLTSTEEIYHSIYYNFTEDTLEDDWGRSVAITSTCVGNISLFLVSLLLLI